MGEYYPNPEAVISGERGRKLEPTPEGTFESYRAQLREGESLWLATNNGRWPLVILVNNPSEFDHTDKNRQGKGDYTYYALAAT